MTWKVVDILRVPFLEKVRGRNSVFKDGGLKVEIPGKEFLRLSHQIPAFRLTEERGGKLRGYLELDPVAVPSIFLQSPTEVVGRSVERIIFTRSLLFPEVCEDISFSIQIAPF